MTVPFLSNLSPARAVPRNVPDFNCGLKQTRSEIDTVAVILVACRIMQYHLQPQCGLQWQSGAVCVFRLFTPWTEEEQINVIYVGRRSRKSELEGTEDLFD